jgi:hypothetical protein
VRLDAQDRAVYEGLRQGYTVKELAKSMNCGWHTVMRRIENIRDILRESGLEEYLPRPVGECRASRANLAAVGEPILRTTSLVHDLHHAVEPVAAAAAQDDVPGVARPA